MSRAEDTRAARELFERALAAGLTPDQLRRRDAEARWRAAEQRLEARRGVAAVEGERDLAWFQR